MMSNKAAVPRPTITLLTDFGDQDWYVASLKGVLLRHNPAARLVDVTHHIKPGDILHASIALERAVAGFMPDTVHLAVVDPGVGANRRLVIFRIHQQWVVCPDNGLITWAARRFGAPEMYEITWRPPHLSPTFHGRDILAPAAAAVAAGVALSELARKAEGPVMLDIPKPSEDGKGGAIIHFDRFGNAITNIPVDYVRDKRVKIEVAGHRLGEIRRTYSDVERGEGVALIGSSELLEISVRDGSAKRDLSLRIGDEVKVIPPEHTTQSLRELDKKHIWHPFTPMSLWLDSDPLVIADAQGMELIDSEGKKYLDGVSSLWCNVHGHRVQEIDGAIREQLERFSHSTMLGLTAEPAIVLADRLMKVVPSNLKKVFYSDSGATAAEVAFKMAVQFWHNVGQGQRKEFIALSEAYHGDTFGSMSVGRTELFHRAYLPMLFKTHYAPTPFVYRPDAELVKNGVFPDEQTVKRHSLDRIRAILRERGGSIAAIVVEPVVQGAAGMIVQPGGYLAEIRKLADEFGVLLVCDEVATGFGRTGRMFACEHEGVMPDLMCVAKGITGGYLPLAATFATQRIFDAFLGDPREGKTFYHGHTYTGNALACAAAIASLELLERGNVVEKAAQKGEMLGQMLEDLRKLPCVGDIRRKGMMVGVELVADAATRRALDPARRTGHGVCMAIRRRGVILRPLVDTIVLMPPLAMETDDLARIVKALGDVLQDVQRV